MTLDDMVYYWFETAEQDYQTMINLFNSKDYHWSLFMGHLVLEKLLKAIYVAKIGTDAPRLHDLLRLAENSDLALSDEQKDWLDFVTTFNIAARYPDYKQSFYRKCTPEFTAMNISHIKELRICLLSVLEKK